MNKSIKISLFFTKKAVPDTFKHSLNVKSSHTYTISAYTASLAHNLNIFSKP